MNFTTGGSWRGRAGGNVSFLVRKETGLGKTLERAGSIFGRVGWGLLCVSSDVQVHWADKGIFF